ncbi:hypothetical protein K2X30_14780 [bacterium]|nr:hypothetical protein [bacterium]
MKKYVVVLPALFLFSASIALADAEQAPWGRKYHGLMKEGMSFDIQFSDESTSSADIFVEAREKINVPVEGSDETRKVLRKCEFKVSANVHPSQLFRPGFVVEAKDIAIVQEAYDGCKEILGDLFADDFNKEFGERVFVPAGDTLMMGELNNNRSEFRVDMKAIFQAVK